MECLQIKIMDMFQEKWRQLHENTKMEQITPH